MNVHELPSPALVVDADAFERNVRSMSAARPGGALRPHVKAFKSTALARELAAAGHTTFCCATPREMEGMAAAGFATDLLLANEVVGDGAARMGKLARSAGDTCRIIVAVDSQQTVQAAADAGVLAVLVDVNVGLPRCGCPPDEAARIAGLARAAGVEVLGVMGYEGHLMRAPAGEKSSLVEASMDLLVRAHGEVGGAIRSGGGTGTYACNSWVTELQAGSYCLMDAEYAHHAPAFEQALHVLGTCISSFGSRAVVDVGAKALGMDHGPPAVDRASCILVSDEHTTVETTVDPLTVGDRVRVRPAHVDPTVACHERMYVVRDELVLDVWPVDLRNW